MSAFVKLWPRHIDGSSSVLSGNVSVWRWVLGTKMTHVVLLPTRFLCFCHHCGGSCCCLWRRKAGWVQSGCLLVHIWPAIELHKPASLSTGFWLIYATCYACIITFPALAAMVLLAPSLFQQFFLLPLLDFCYTHKLLAYYACVSTVCAKFCCNRF